MKLSKLLFFPLLFSLTFIFAQSGAVSILIYDQFSQKPLNGHVKVLELNKIFYGEKEVVVDSLAAKTYNFEIYAPHYDTAYLNNIDVVPNQHLIYSVGLIKKTSIDSEISEVVVRYNTNRTTAESPLSLRNLSSEEIQKNAGANRDISKAVLSLPGVASTVSFRNDLLVRGGSSLENKFYIDGIEVPTINHFQTQGATGGPRGILTVDFIKDVDFYSGAFPARRPGVLSSLFEFNFKQARKNKLGYKAVLGIDDMQFMMDGPMSKDQSWSTLFSVRKSNLQLLFRGIGLAFLPSYYDTNLKISKKFENGNELYLIGVGAIDEFKLNLDAKKTPQNMANLDRIPISPQWNYTLGVGYKMLAENGSWLFTASRNMLDNQSTKFFRNIEIPGNLILDYHSQELEHKVKADRAMNFGNYKLSFGVNVGHSKYFNNTYNRYIARDESISDRYQSDLNLWQYGAYAQISNLFFNDRLNASAGLRVDASSYSTKTNNALEQFSPRLSLAYKIDDHWGMSFNAGIFYQLPPFTALGFNINQDYINEKQLKYIRNSQLAVGVNYTSDNQLKLTLESYYKKYKNYPFSLRNQTSLANATGGFGVVGAEPLDSRSVGEAYGVEFLAQKKTVNNYYGIFSYTYGYSKFSNADGVLQASSWDARHIASLTAGKYFGKNWNLGARFRAQSGFPETPYDDGRSALVNVWNVANGPIQNYNLLNTQRGKMVHQLDVRVEKKWIFSKWQITGYMDVVNIYRSNNPSNLPIVNIERDSNGIGIIANPTAPLAEQKYNLTYDQQDKQSALPYLGIIIEF